MPCILPLTVTVDITNSNATFTDGQVHNAVWTPQTNSWQYANLDDQFIEYTYNCISGPLADVSPNGETVLNFTDLSPVACNPQVIYTDSGDHTHWVTVTANGAEQFVSFSFAQAIYLDLTHTQSFASYGIVILYWNPINFDYEGLGPNELSITYNIGGNDNTNITCLTGGHIYVQDRDNPQEQYTVGQPDNNGNGQTYWNFGGTYYATTNTSNLRIASPTARQLRNC